MSWIHSSLSGSTPSDCVLRNWLFTTILNLCEIRTPTGHLQWMVLVLILHRNYLCIHWLQIVCLPRCPCPPVLPLHHHRLVWLKLWCRYGHKYVRFMHWNFMLWRDQVKRRDRTEGKVEAKHTLTICGASGTAISSQSSSMGWVRTIEM